MTKKLTRPPHKIGVFVLAMMNVAIVMSLRGLPLMAKEGLALIFFIAFSTIVFLIPTSLVSAELATGWPVHGGVYRWVKEAFGGHLGFTAIWLQWIQNVIWYPTVLAFAAGALSYFFIDPSLAENKFFNIAIILIVYWGATLMNFRGMKTSGWITTTGTIVGTIFPAALIIILGFIWWLLGKPIAFAATSHSIFPDFSNPGNISFLAGIVTLFAGMEVSAVHALEMKNPRKNYPKAIFIAAVLIVIVFTLGSLAIAAVIPADKISLTAGIMEGFKSLLNNFGMGWLLPVMGLLLAFGIIASVTAWIIGPSKGLFSTASDGDLPPIFTKVNKQGVTTHILIIQGVIVTVLSLLFIIMPNVNSAFFILTALTGILYLIMYLLMFAAAIRLRYSQPKIHRAYKIPGGNFGMWIVAGIGFLGAIFAISVGLIPPAQLTIGSPLFYVCFLIIGAIIFVLAPIIIIHLKNPSWEKNYPYEEKHKDNCTEVHHDSSKA